MAQRRDPPWRRWPRYQRDLPGAWQAIDDLRDAVDEIVEADRIAEAVTEKMREQRKERLSLGDLELSKRQTWAAIIGVFFAAIAFIVNTLAQVGVFG